MISLRRFRTTLIPRTTSCRERLSAWLEDAIPLERVVIFSLTVVCFLSSSVAMADDPDDHRQGTAVNRSTPTKCAEEDNINVSFFKPKVRQFRITASHPPYEIGRDNCRPDFSNCPQLPPNGPAPRPDQPTKVFDDGMVVVEVCKVDGWWRKKKMQVAVGGKEARGHYVRVYRKIENEPSYPQVVVIYQDGNVRLKSHPPAHRSDTCFGSSFIVGPAPPSKRPYVDIKRIAIAPSSKQIDFIVSYAKGGSSHLALTVNRTAATLLANVHFTTDEQTPFGIFRSMWVANDNCDVARIKTSDREWPILNWKSAKASNWFFYRSIRSKHNTSAPDLKIEILR